MQLKIKQGLFLFNFIFVIPLRGMGLTSSGRSRHRQMRESSPEMEEMGWGVTSKARTLSVQEVQPFFLADNGLVSGGIKP